MFTTKSYHGTSPDIVNEILTNGISVSLGGGELGQGFYSGEYLYEAKAWALHKSSSRKKNVIELEHLDEDILNLEIEELTHSQANLKRSSIKKSRMTRAYKFNVDLVWSPIVGTDKISGNQFKWESSDAETLLNNPSKTTKKVF